MRFELYIAIRYLRAKRRQAVVGLVTLISVAGVAAGVAALVVALAITNGMQRDFQDRLLGSTSHVTLMRVKNDGIHNWEPLLERMRHLPHVMAAAPGMYEQVMISNGPRAGFALLKAIIPAQERTVSDLLGMITTGSAADLAPGESSLDSADAALPPLVIGNELAETLGVSVGDSVMATSPQGELTPLGVIPSYRKFRVAGIFHSGFYQYDSATGFLRLSDAQKLFSEPDVITVINFKIDDLDQAEAVGREIEQAAGKGFQTSNWMDENRELFTALALEKTVTFIIIGLIVLVAALNILIALTMMVMEKTRDIAVLMSFGVLPGQVRRIFLMQGLLISLLGTAAGLVMGYVASWAGGHYHFIHLSAAVYNIDTLPFAPSWRDGVLVALVSIGVSLLATVYPSSTAAAILPAEALRYE
ncbi:FtsX-like permease family protein [Acidicapsa acidisoli]|uniref:FtsX-like permease family protein n=1 Tax=Acidicapsa acidisoli TaxID=1615681 RepID=UPI0021E0B31D|nr:FtsX-like permease family protein [Acidicapsa acidisoli]